MRQPLIIEFSGMPKSGKTTILDIVARYFRKREFRVVVIRDEGDAGPSNSEQLGDLNIFLAAKVVKGMFDYILHEQGVRTIVFVDRGVFDRLVFTNVLFEMQLLNSSEKFACENFLSQNRILSNLAKVFLFITSSDRSIQREQNNSLTTRQGRFTDPRGLSMFRSQSVSLADKYNRSAILSVTLVDTDKYDGDIHGTAWFVASEIEIELGRRGMEFEECRYENMIKNGNTLIRNDIHSKRIGPKLIFGKDGKRYFRYTNHFYYPKRISDMDVSDSLELCDARLEDIDKVLNLDLHKVIIGCMASEIRRKGGVGATHKVRILDYGCGSGSSIELI